MGDGGSGGVVNARPIGEFYLLGRCCGDRDWDRFRCKAGEWVFLTAGERFSRDVDRAVCFFTAKAAGMFLRRLPWQLKERLDIVPLVRR